MMPLGRDGIHARIQSIQKVGESNPLQTHEGDELS